MPADDSTTALRRDRLRSRIRELDADAALITNLINVRYLTGFTGSNAALIVGADPADDLFSTDGRYVEQSKAQVPDVPLLIGRASAQAVAAEVGQRLGTIAYETHSVSVDVAEALQDAAPAARLVSLGAAVEGLRAIKDDEEIALLRQAAHIADQALTELIEAGGIIPGRSERDIAIDLDFRMLRLGAEEVSFETIVATGPNSAIPHHRPGERVLESGDLGKIDFGATYRGYHSDMTRTYGVGSIADWQREIYEAVASAQRAGAQALRIGRTGKEVDTVSRDIIADAGYGETFAHSLGHGVGLEVHEAPNLSQLSETKLEDRVCVTVEPGVYLAGRGGVRIEDTLVLREDAEADGATRTDLLTMTSKDLVIL
ncbi:aminopeptidase P family protein [Blastococcus sp. Marseille-P5729]|uniref:aminopeptidase P family protein n=1 Tax=Blastococcus sp. Marseille-P5729 TaxID=2086582 RepID=UPI000D0FCC20|nr:aminopeptidase P family protein [Blastococcus sp. Marseille-P5729]